jgi:hypothetical protein
VYVHALGGACTLKGERAYDWLSRLAPYLTGEQTLEELVGPLPDDQRSMVTELVGTLSEQRFVVDVVSDEPHLLDEDEQRVYAAEIAFIRYGLDSAPWRFQRVRQARITLIGAGPVASALLAAGLWSGWRTVRMLAPAAELPALEQLVTSKRRDPKQSVRLQPWPETPETPNSEIIDGADVVLQICVEANRADLITLSRACAGTQTALGQVLICADEAWLTPVGASEVIEAESCWRRLNAWRDTGADAEQEWLTGPVPDIIAAQLALSCFSHLTGLDTLRAPERAPQPPVLTRIDLRTLVTRTHRVRPHPLARPQDAPTEADTRAVLDELASATPVAAADLLERAGAVIDGRTGLLGILDEEELSQIPLSVCRASVCDPYGVLPSWAPAPIVTGWGHDRPTARLRALLAALATYGSLSTGEDPEQQWGLDLVIGALRPVPAAVVYPARREVPYRAPIGAAAGRCWSDAIAAGLRAHCEALLTGRRDGGTQFDADGITDEHASYLLRLLHAAGQHVSVTDLSGVLGLPAFACHPDPAAHPVLTCAATQTEALRDGLERTVLRWQAGDEGLPVTRWSVEVDEPRSGGPGDDPRCRILTNALHRAGQVPLAVPLTPDREARTVLPYVVQVVLCHD